MKTTKIYLYIGLMLIVTSFYACKQEKLISLDAAASIYFFESNRPLNFQGEVLRDSTLLEFSHIFNMDSIQPIVIATISKATAADRPYILAIEPSSTAQEGLHYEILNKEFIIRKNTIQDTVFIKWFRTADMQVHSRNLKMTLKPNTHFDTNLRERITNPNTAEKISHIHYEVIAHDMIPKPLYWFDPYFHTFSRKKFLLICEVFQFEPIYFINLTNMSEMSVISKLMQRYLNEQKAAGNIIYDEDGSEMIMGSSAQ